ncbi:T9SS type A sorting domain-containing protein [Flavobacterium dankookense]|uniref:Putative repeat protein (TIGR01451 family)/predicted secreted protein (Por secretion system target) n=1 Tax=Flavobacterium dankookense TaxID=706186 RepID=A0A4R6Q843_9FLAO|nr:T9SS type A sorting domain-containing protein [Flavobacterium dankookense]TDP57996.1 putative repeat protein (TIGR01451 family)/predicted secreted protein (Por secretion system target) [Flavobacterium dankookense]
MKKFYKILVLVFFATGSAQIVNIPDANFKAKLLEASPDNAIAFGNDIGYIKIDANSNGEIEESEAQIVTYLDVKNSNISNLTGIEFFINLLFLNVSNNQLTSLDLSSNNQLETLICPYNQLTNLNVNSLINIDASHNQLMELNLNFIEVSDEYETFLDLSYNNLISFTATNSFFYRFDLSNNQLSSLILNNLTINNGRINNNNLTAIDFQGYVYVYGVFDIANNQFINSNVNATYYCSVNNLYIGNNNLIDIIPYGINADNVICQSNNTVLDLTGFFGLPSSDPSYPSGTVTITNSPNLEIITIKNGFNHTSVTNNDEPEEFQISSMRLDISNCPNLSYFCVDELEQPYIQASINQLGLGNQVQVNSYCSFTPGGEFCTIQGTTRLDNDSNGCDANDIIFPNQQFTATNGTVSGLFISNESGNYSIPVQQGTHTITPVFENPSYFNVSPASITVSFPSAASPFTQDFCVTANGVKNDVEVTTIPIEVARPGFDANYKIIYKNKGNQVANGTVSFGFDDTVMDLVSATPVNDNAATNSLSWNYSNLNPFETREIDLVFNINSPMEIPAVNGDDVLDYTATIVGATDETPNDNTFTLNQTVVNSYDPNDKTCLEGSTITPSMVGQYVHYVIRFENTGTFAAQNIVVKDMIDTTKFDITTLVPQRSSHDFYTRINGNRVEFIFENINLPFDDANNDGYVAFKIKTKPTLVLGNTFSNEASIYFDYNFPIITEPAVTTVAALSNQDFDFGSYFTLYPNPAKEVLNFEVKNEIGVKSIQVYNTLGQILLAVTNASTTRSIDVASLNAGAYFIKVGTDKGSTNSKFIKE